MITGIVVFLVGAVISHQLGQIAKTLEKQVATQDRAIKPKGK